MVPINMHSLWDLQYVTASLCKLEKHEQFDFIAIATC